MTKPRSRLLEAVHESAAGLYKAGVIDARRMREYDALCLPAPEFSAEQIKDLRSRHNLSQTVLARVLNTSPSTVRQWEIGQKHPSGPSKRLLQILERKGLEGVL